MINKLQYALKDSILVHIDDVEKGLKCGCQCPSCGSPLVAKKGKIMMHHFAHYNSEDCNNGIETAYHILAKEILSEELTIRLPAVFIEFGEHTFKTSEKLYDEMLFRFDKVYLEKKVDDIVPDIIVEKNGSKLFVEIFVTHDIDDVKLNKIKKIGISTLTIDLSKIDDAISKEKLKDIIIHNVENKRWVYNKKANVIYKRFEKKARPFEHAKNGTGYFCPQYKYGWKGESSARMHDCINCDYCFSIDGEVNCLGYSGVVTIKDLDDPQLAEQAKKLRIENKIKPEWLEGTQCKKCRNGYMKLREGKDNKFLGCSNYPNCKNTINI